MPVPPSQLETWSNRSQTQTAVNAHTILRESLRAADSPIRIINFVDYLQGSYVNATNVWRDSDVDIVVQLNAAFNYTFDQSMSITDQALCQSAITPAFYHLEHFRPSVIERLGAVFGTDKVKVGNKAVRVEGELGERLDADVVICQQHRHYYAYNGNLSFGYHEGIAFRDQRDGRLIVNYPKQHLANGEAKNGATNGGFKKTVRVYKNARNYLIDHDYLPEGSAPSYFLQGLLYNVPIDRFSGDPEPDFLSSLVWLAENLESYEGLYCQNGLIKLFGDTPEQWDLHEAAVSLNKLMWLYNNWS